MSDIQRYAPWPQEWPQEDPNGDLVEYEDHKKIVDALQARAERLEAALRETTQVLRQCTFPYIRVKGQYLDREEVVSRADAALKGANHD